MDSRKTILAQILGGLSSEEFARCTRKFPTCREAPALSAYDHLATMVFAQLTYRECRRDIEACLQARQTLLYHAGVRGTVKRCNLAYANENCDWRLLAEVAGQADGAGPRPGTLIFRTAVLGAGGRATTPALIGPTGAGWAEGSERAAPGGEVKLMGRAWR